MNIYFMLKLFRQIKNSFRKYTFQDFLNFYLLRTQIVLFMFSHFIRMKFTVEIMLSNILFLFLAGFYLDFQLFLPNTFSLFFFHLLLNLISYYFLGSTSILVYSRKKYPSSRGILGLDKKKKGKI